MMPDIHQQDTAHDVAEQEKLQQVLQGDAQELPCEDASFDVVTCRQAAHHFPSVRQGVREWARVLRPGGKLVLIDSISPEEPESEALLHEIEVLRDPSHVRSQRLSEWIALLNEAGFIVSATREWGIDLDIPSWTQRMRTPTESVALIKRRLHDASPAVRECLRIKEKEGVFAFTMPAALIVAVKTVQV